jgi:malonyl-CoA O-methyltransferase
MVASLVVPSKKRVAARFGRAVDSYEPDAGVQMEILTRVAELVSGAAGGGQLWCDVGSGGGALMERLRLLSCEARFVCFDLAFAPLRRALALRRAAFAINGDIDFPPVRAGSFHGAAAASVLQWSSSPEGALTAIARMLRPGGALCFSAFVAGSFEELVETRSRLGLPAVVWLPTVGELLMALDRAGFEAAADAVENFERAQRFPNALSALGSLNRMGVTATGGRLLNRSELDELCRTYTLAFRRDGAVPLTYRAVIGRAWKRDS